MIILSLSLHGSETAHYSLLDASKYWNYAPLETIKDERGTVGIKQFRRYVKTNGSYLPISTLSLVEVSTQSEDFLPQYFIDRLKKHLPYVRNFSYRRSAKEMKIRWYDSKLLKHFDLYYLKKADSFLIMTTISLPEFYSLLTHEITQFERLASTVKTPLYISHDKIQTLHQDRSSFFVNTFFPNSYAQMLTASNPLQILTDGSNNLIGNSKDGSLVSSSHVVNVKLSMDPILEQTFKETNKTGTELSSALTMSVKEFDTTMKNSLAETSKTGNELTQALTTSMKQFDATMGNSSTALTQATTELTGASQQATKEITASMENLNKTLGMTYDPALIAEVAFAGSAGAALGSIFIGLVADGISLAATGLYNLVTQNPKKEKLWENFHKSMKEIDEQNSALAKYESDLRAMLGYAKTLRGMGLLNKPFFELEETLEMQKYVLEEMLERHKEKFKEVREELPLKCAAKTRKDIASLEETLKKMNNVLVAFKNEDKQLLLTEKICRQLADLKRQVVYLQQSLQTARYNILANEKEFAKKLKSEGENLEDIIDDANKAHQKGQERMTKLVRQYAKTAKESLAYGECLSGESSLGKQITKKTKIFSSHQRYQNRFEVEKLCLQALYPQIKGDEFIFEDNTRPLKFSSIQQKEYVLEYISFFNQIKEENLCLERLLSTHLLPENEVKAALANEISTNCRFSDRVVKLFTSKKAIETEMEENRCGEFMKSFSP